MTQNNIEFRFVGGREVRVIPRGWQHPRIDGGRYQPLLPADYALRRRSGALAPDAGREPAA